MTLLVSRNVRAYMVRFHGAGYLGESIGCRTYLESLTRVSRASGETRVRARDVRAREPRGARAVNVKRCIHARLLLPLPCVHTPRGTRLYLVDMTFPFYCPGYGIKKEPLARMGMCWHTACRYR